MRNPTQACEAIRLGMSSSQTALETEHKKIKLKLYGKGRERYIARLLTNPLIWFYNE